MDRSFDRSSPAPAFPASHLTTSTVRRFGRFGDTDTSASEDEGGFARHSQSMTPPPRQRLLSTGSNSSRSSPGGSQGNPMDRLRSDRNHTDHETDHEADVMNERKITVACDSLILAATPAMSPVAATYSGLTPPPNALAAHPLTAPVEKEVAWQQNHARLRRVSQGHRPLTTGDNRPSSPLSRPDKHKRGGGPGLEIRQGKRPSPYEKGGKKAHPNRRKSLLVNAEGPESPVATSSYGMTSGPNSGHGLPTSPFSFRRGPSQGSTTPTGLSMGFELAASAGSTTGSDAEEMVPAIKIPEIHLTQAWGTAGDRDPSRDSGMESEET